MSKLQGTAVFIVFALNLYHGVLSNFIIDDATEINIANSQELYRQRLQMHDEKYRDNLMLKRIHKARRRNATCMDGSDARYYLSRQWKSSNWLIHLQGGGSCITKEDCRKRSEGPLGSSILLEDSLTGEYTLSNDPRINPTFAKWNKVFITYCSGDVFVGRKLRKHHPYRFPMLGHYIFKAVIEDLVRLYKVNKKGTKILFGGTSAGGVGVIANADLLQQMTYPAEVKAYNDGGWFTLFRNFGEPITNGLPDFFQTFSLLFENHWDGYSDESCRENMDKPAACLYGELATQYVKTPMFVMSSVWDLYQLIEMVSINYEPINLPPSSNEEIQFLSSYRNNSHRSIRQLLSNPRNGIFSPACFAHIFFTNCIGGNICGNPRKKIFSSGGQSAYGALSEWYKSDGAEGSYIDNVLQTSTCNPTCCTSHCYKCSSVDDVINTETNNLIHNFRRKKKESTKNDVEISSSKSHNDDWIVYYSSATSRLSLYHFFFVPTLAMLVNKVVSLFSR